MKFSIASWNPFAWLKQEPMTANQIRLYDIGQAVADLDEEIMESELNRIVLEHERAGLIAQKNFILEGEPDEYKNQTNLRKFIQS